MHLPGVNFPVFYNWANIILYFSGCGTVKMNSFYINQVTDDILKQGIKMMFDKQ